MTKPQRNADEELWNLMTVLADSVLDASDDEILEETERAEGIADDTRALLLEGVRTMRQERRQRARDEYEESVSSMSMQETGRIPKAVTEQRALLFQIMSERPQVSAALTAQFRDFRELSDEDVLSYLRQLQELGVMDELVDEDE
jgi:hypothetical protein